MLKSIKTFLKPCLSYIINISYLLIILSTVVRGAYYIVNNLETVVVAFVALIVFGIPVALVCINWYGFFDSLFK